MFILLTQIWIVLSAALHAAGWVLSGAGMFNLTGVTLVVIGVAGWSAWHIKQQRMDLSDSAARLFRRIRFEARRPLPALFFLLVGLTFLAGALYAPMHVDALSYRIPRLLHYAAESRWHWILTPDTRMNAPSPGPEFLVSPLLFWTKSERFFFLYNWFSFLLLPALVFFVFTRVGVRPRVAWWWMWLLPTGYCYVMQASSLGNDSYGTVYALAAIGFALRARQSGQARDVWFSMLAMATLTGAKQTNAILGLPWLIAILPCWRIAFKKPALLLLVGALSLFASMIPGSYYNLKHAGNWKGFPADKDYVPESPLWGVIGNTVAVPAQNLQLPVCPWISDWNALMLRISSSEEFGPRLKGFEVFGNLSRTPSDQTAGLGFTLCVTAAIAWFAGFRHRKRKAPLGRRLIPLHASFWVVLLLAFAMLGSTQNARYLAPLYPLLLATLVSSPGQSIIVRRRWWRVLTVVGVLSTIAVLAASRQRPLWPAQTISTFLAAKFPESGLLQKVKNAFTFFPEIEETREFLRTSIPPEEKFIGYAADIADKEVPLWKPLWTRRVFRVVKQDTSESLKARGINYVVLDPTAFREPRYDLHGTNWVSVENWSDRVPSEVVAVKPVRLDPQSPPANCYVVKLK